VGLGPRARWSAPRRRSATRTVDVVVLQRPYELQLVEQWTGRRPGRDLPAVYLEHDAPAGQPHPMGDQSVIPVVHCTHFNRLMWDSGRAPVRVVEHGIVDPGERWTGELAASATAINDPVRRGRTVGTDLLTTFADAGVEVDVFGMRTDLLPPRFRTEDLPQQEMHDALARRRSYLHLARWTSLGLSLLEAMALGMPVIALATTEAVEAVPPEAGAISTDVDRLVAAARLFRDDREAAAVAGKAAREAVLQRYGLERFLADWDRILEEVTA